MSSKAILPIGTKLFRNGVAMQEIISVDGLEPSAKEVDVSNGDSKGFAVAKSGQKSLKDITIKANYILNDPVQLAMVADYATGAEADYVVEGPDEFPMSFSFPGWIKGYKPDLDPIGGKQATITFTIKATEAPSLTSQLSNNLTALTASLGTLSPAFVGGTNNYTLVLPAATASITVTATQAGASKILAEVYDASGNQLSSQVLTTGVASGAISTPVGYERIDITTQDTGKVANTYHLHVTRST